MSQFYPDSFPASPIGPMRLAEGRFGDMVKGVVDLDRRVMLLDADLHADQEAELVTQEAIRTLVDALVRR